MRGALFFVRFASVAVARRRPLLVPGRRSLFKQGYEMLLVGLLPW